VSADAPLAASILEKIPESGTDPSRCPRSSGPPTSSMSCRASISTARRASPSSWGLVAASTSTALLFTRERRRSMRRERRLLAELETLRGAEDRVALLMGTERQILLTWSGRSGEPRYEGDPSIAGEGATVKRVLAFGSWLAPADAAALEKALDLLRERGEAFHLTARTPGRELRGSRGAHGRRPRDLRLRDVTGDGRRRCARRATSRRPATTSAP
jgi:hypothetical protein